MASGKLSARQKMINLMYLIFIAMIAMQMSKEVLSAFGYMNEKLSDNNVTATEKNNATLENLATKASEQKEKYAELYETAKKVDELSKSFNAYLDAKKTLFLEDQDDLKNYEAMDKIDIVNEHFFVGDGFTAEGQEFIDRVNGYRDNIIALLNEGNMLVPTIKKRFDTSDQETEDGKQAWLKNRYEGFPLISTVTNLTSMQTDIKTTQSEIYGTLLGGQLESDVSMSNYKTILIPEKSAFFQGENFKGKIVLGRYDSSLKPSEVVVNGRNITKIEDGGAILDFPAGAVGERDVKGKFIFIENGEPVEIEINSSYAVIPKPNSAVISADKMNVVYRGVANPMTISIPGIPDNLVTANGIGLARASGSGKYIMTPGAGKEVKISVSGKLPNGQTVTTSQVFRIKGIPSPSGSIRKQIGYVKMPKTSLENSTVGALLEDFDFDLELRTSGFTLKVPGQGAVVVRGNKMDAQAKKAIAKAKRGDVVTIFDIKSSLVGNSTYKIKSASAVSIEIQ
ncbi:MAG: gliding motility protein GldM [Lutibacter sp.]|uniref:type IX secretion system motor protein PorM/GldM n=1 Tax=Lutibacter sp. TaxID=1925666 RepID=UPI001838791D|nr:gliding motility protein GldM [Lutibacter sp.]MBT8316821.1 gliding motility protein GldM [Lutibacter sp.]NNJ57681.1 gliding motility protein GldM [Lutibacter sp.]